jgi:CheY-like chemotaxis protein
MTVSTNDSCVQNNTQVQTSPRKTIRVIDNVFTQVGFDKCFLDNPQPPRRPHIKTQEVEMPLILHDDDDVDLVDAVTSRLKANGYRVACALDGISGVQAALLYPADAIILDYDMPNGRADTVIDLLKANDRTKDIPIVVLTAIQKKSLKRELLSKGADMFMTKPFDFEELQENVTSLIDTKN